MVKESITVLSFNEKDTLNPFSVKMGSCFQALLPAIQESGTKCLIVTGEGRAFSAGGDMKFLLERKTVKPL